MDKWSKIIQRVGISAAAFVLAGFIGWMTATTPSVSHSADLTYIECATIRTC